MIYRKLAGQAVFPKYGPMAIDLAYHYFGTEGKTPLVVLHGLFGSSRNWHSACRELSNHWDAFALDLRNHGESPWSATMGFEEMVDDLVLWLNKQKLAQVCLLGHSLGGKVAMRAACRFPERVKGLVVADIVPKQYSLGISRYVDRMLALDLSKVSSRKDADALLADDIGDARLRQFFLLNLKRKTDAGEGAFQWKVNLPVIRDALKEISGPALEDGDSYEGPALFMRGSRSDFIADADKALLERHFPHYTMSTIPEAGHNIHTDNLAAVLKTISLFTERNPGLQGK